MSVLSQAAGKTPLTRGRAIGILGTVARVAGGLGLIYLAVILDVIKGTFTWETPILGLIVFPAVLLAWQPARLRRTTAPLRATGPAEVLLHHVGIAVLVAVPWTREATTLFYGTSMPLAAVRGYAGCEVLAISNWVLRRDDQAGCLMFSPIDSLEARWARRQDSVMPAQEAGRSRVLRS